jgi:hypothetical protein
MICPEIATAAAVRRNLPKLRMKSEAASGTPGINQRLETIQGVIL